MAGFGSLGIGSGLPLDQLLTDLVAAEKRPKEQALARRQSALNAELSALGKFKSALSAFESKLDSLGETEPARKVSVSNSNALSVTADDNVALGDYRINVIDLAQGQSVASAGYADSEASVGNGQLQFTFGDGRTETLDIASGSDDLASVRDAINDADIGLSASIVNDGSGARLTLNSQSTGLDNAITSIAVSGDGDGNDTDNAGLSALSFDTGGGASFLTETQSAQDARFEINGLEVTAAQNTVDTAIDGLSITLKETTDTTATLSISEDRGAVKSDLQGFVKSYNELVKTIDSLTSFDLEANTRSALVGDSLLRNVEGSLRRSLSDQFGGDGFESSLVELGITGKADGTLELNEEEFDAAVESNFEGVVGVLNAFGGAVAENVASYTADDGVITQRTENIDNRLDGLQDDFRQLESRIESYRSRLQKEFGALDALVGSLQSQQERLQSQLAQIPVPGQSK